MGVNLNNSGRPAPRWFRKFKKIFVNTETAAIVIMLSAGYTQDSLILLLIKTGTSWIIENLETLLANGEDYVSNVEAEKEKTQP